MINARQMILFNPHVDTYLHTYPKTAYFQYDFFYSRPTSTHGTKNFLFSIQVVIEIKLNEIWIPLDNLIYYIYIFINEIDKK